MALLLYALFVGLVFFIRPGMMFDENGRFKTWSCNTNSLCSVFAPAFVFPFLGIFAYLIASLIELMADA
jgi:hypothetical protein